MGPTRGWLHRVMDAYVTLWSQDSTYRYHTGLLSRKGYKVGQQLCKLTGILLLLLKLATRESSSSLTNLGTASCKKAKKTNTVSKQLAASPATSACHGSPH